jgi:hypothetical protein
MLQQRAKAPKWKLLCTALKLVQILLDSAQESYSLLVIDQSERLLKLRIEELPEEVPMRYTVPSLVGSPRPLASCIQLFLERK